MAETCRYSKLLMWAAFLGALGSTPAAASIIPAETSSATCTFDSTIVMQGATNCSVNGGTGLVTLAPFAGDSAQVASGPGDAASVLLNLTYSFAVLGGTAGQEVPLLITADLQSASTSESASAAIIDVSTFYGLMSEATCSATSCGHPQSDFGTFSVMARAGDVNSIELIAEASIGFNPNGTETASASADPLIAIDPTFPSAGQYSIQLSSGVANAVAPAPEPATIWLLAGSLLAACFLRARLRDQLRNNNGAKSVKLMRQTGQV